MVHYDANAIEQAAVDIGDGYREAVITLAKGDTAESFLSDKWQFGGVGSVSYLMHPSGYTVSPGNGINKMYL
jgi:hypothetical protein